jgi:hypothetical protein
MTSIRRFRLAVVTIVSIVGLGAGVPVAAFDGEKPLYEAAKKEKEFTCTPRTTTRRPRPRSARASRRSIPA